MNETNTSVTIKLEGPQGSGKTLLGNLILRKLREEGIECEWDDYGGFEHKISITDAVSKVLGEEPK